MNKTWIPFLITSKLILHQILETKGEFGTDWYPCSESHRVKAIYIYIYIYISSPKRNLNSKISFMAKKKKKKPISVYFQIKCLGIRSEYLINIYPLMEGRRSQLNKNKINKKWKHPRKHSHWKIESNNRTKFSTPRFLILSAFLSWKIGFSLDERYQISNNSTESPFENPSKSISHLTIDFPFLFYRYIWSQEHLFSF